VQSGSRGIVVNANKRPLSVTILACTYIAVGSIGFAYHLHPIFARHAFYRDDLLIELTEVAAILSGAFILRGDNWARWLGLVWIGFHVLISFFDSLQRIAVHALFFVVIAYFLFRPQARAYFLPQELETNAPQ
jgi:hypothetical protein